MHKLFSLLFALTITTGLTADDTQWVHEYIATVPDFPKPGIQFKCYPDLLKNPEAFHKVIQTFAARY
ncbi:hypothetical protein COV53_00230, partial [Candidatus Gottesmanbacteria bacterium CG11_big_fil_rev_8_21_14_0_20_37_11]